MQSPDALVELFEALNHREAAVRDDFDGSTQVSYRANEMVVGASTRKLTGRSTRIAGSRR